MANSYGLHWFRRDLRIKGNPALRQNLELHQGRVVGVFFFDSEFLSRPDFSHNRFGFFLKTLKALKEELKSMGGDLLVINTRPEQGFRLIFESMSAKSVALPVHCSFNRDYEPFAIQRDSAVLKLLGNAGVEALTAADHLLIEPSKLRRPDGGTYQVFTPFSKRWVEIFSKSEVTDRISEEKKARRREIRFALGWNQLFGGSHPFSDELDRFIALNSKQLTVPLPDAGSEVAFQALLQFKKKISTYGEGRDFPALKQNSNLSIYLKNGSLTTAQIFSQLHDHPDAKPFLRQLVWREFYYHILFHHPRVEKEAFIEKYKNIRWENREDWFTAWKEGRTGYPLVDAGMRELMQTGLMHNRVRMVVASFLTKDLLIDWRWGEQWFMKNLLDGDLAANNGGWQWAASTGCDPQPYFRIFNPVLQSKRFDPNGDYIRKYVPELKNSSDREIHEPVDPIVNHAEQKLKAVGLFK